MKTFKIIQMLLMSLVFFSLGVPGHLHSEMEEGYHQHHEENAEQVEHRHCHNGHDVPESDELDFLFPLTSGGFSCCQHSLPDGHVVLCSITKPSNTQQFKIVQISEIFLKSLYFLKNHSALAYANSCHLLVTTACPDRISVLRI